MLWSGSSMLLRVPASHCQRMTPCKKNVFNSHWRLRWVLQRLDFWERNCFEIIRICDSVIVVNAALIQLYQFNGLRLGTPFSSRTSPTGLYTSEHWRAFSSWLCKLSTSWIWLCPGSQNFYVMIVNCCDFLRRSIIAVDTTSFLFWGTQELLQIVTSFSSLWSCSTFCSRTDKLLAMSFPVWPLSVSGQRTP